MKNLGMKQLIVLSFLSMSIVSLPLSASAEWYADLYAGGAFTQNTDVTQRSSLGVTLEAKNLDVDTSITGGGRVGYWFERVPWYGLGLDVFYFSPDISTQNATFTTSGGGSATAPYNKTSFNVVGIGFDVLRLRAPLMKSAEFPHGRVQPYLTAGPALFVTQLKDSNAFQPNNQSKTDTSIGVKVGAGVSFQLTKMVGLFGEYRFTHFKADGTFQDTTPPPSTETVEATFNTHHAIGGISFRF